MAGSNNNNNKAAARTPTAGASSSPAPRMTDSLVTFPRRPRTPIAAAASQARGICPSQIPVIGRSRPTTRFVTGSLPTQRVVQIQPQAGQAPASPIISPSRVHPSRRRRIIPSPRPATPTGAPLAPSPPSPTSPVIRVSAMMTQAKTVEEQLAEIQAAMRERDEQLRERELQRDLQIATILQKFELIADRLGASSQPRNDEGQAGPSTSANPIPPSPIIRSSPAPEHPVNREPLLEEPGALSYGTLQEMISNAVEQKVQSEGVRSQAYTRPYSRWIQAIHMPTSYHPPKFQQFSGDGNPKQHVAHFMRPATMQELTEISSWEQLESEFLSRFYNTKRTVTLVELTNLKQRHGEKVIEYINRWRNLRLNCKESTSLFTQTSIDMCIRGMNWTLVYFLQSRKPRDFQELVTEAHNMEILIQEKGEGKAPMTEADKKPKFVKKESKAPAKEALATNIAEPQKITATQNKNTGSDWKPNVNRLASTAISQKFTLKDRQAKTYPFPDSDVPGMLEQLLERTCCSFQKPKGHPTEKCFVLKDRILELVTQGRIILETDDNTVTSHTIFVQSDFGIKTKNPRTNKKFFIPCTARPRPQPATKDKEGWEVVTRKKKPIPEAPVKIFIKGYAAEKEEPKRKKVQKKRGGRRHRRKSTSAKVEEIYKKKPKPITLADFFPSEFLTPTPALVATCSPPALVATCSPQVVEQRREGKAPIEFVDDIHTCLQDLSITNAVHDDLDLPIRSRQALIKFVAAKDDWHAEVEQLKMRRHDEPKIGLSPSTLKEEQAAEPPQIKEAHSISISFKEANMLLGEKSHNRPLFVSGAIKDRWINHILLDSGSAVNILPIWTLKNVGLVANDLQDSSLMIQGFNQEGQRALGTIKLELLIGDMTSHVLFHVIDARTSYNVLLGRPWLHSNRVIPSTLHQCFKYYQDGEEKTVFADECPFTEAEASFADAKYYSEEKGATSSKAIPPNAVKDERVNLKGQTEEPILRYVPQSRRKKGESPFTTCDREEPAEKLKALKGIATIPLPKLNNRGILEEKRSPPKLPKIRTEGFDPNAYRMMAKAGSGFSLKQLQMKPVTVVQNLSPTQKNLQAQGYSIPSNRHGLGYQEHEPVVISGKASVNQITTKRKASTSEENRTSAFDRIGVPEPRVSAFVRLGQEENRSPNIPAEPSNKHKLKVTKVWRKKGQAEDPKPNTTAPPATEKLSVFQRQGKSEQPKRTVFQRLGASTRVPVTQRLGKIEENSSKRIKADSNKITPVVIYMSSKKKDPEEKEEAVVHHISIDEGDDPTLEMPGLDPTIAIHKLAIKSEVKPIKQSQRRFRPELVPEIEKEVDKLLKADFIRVVKYPSWIANIIPVKKKNGQIRVCVDFRDLNKACPKDDFPLPITELMVDATTGHEALSFMDGSSGYNQIRMDPKDEEKTAFRTPKGIFCYKLKMNPLKCAFGVSSGKFLGFVVTHRGIEIDQTKINVIQQMPEPKTLSELKSLQGHLAYIRRFISNLAGRCQPFSHLMKKDTPFEWDESCRRAFQNIKDYLMKPPVLMAPTSGKHLLLYFAAQEKSLGALLAQNDDQGKEYPLKFIMSRPMLSGRLAKWALLLAEFEINFIPQKAIKGQGLANFLADHPIPAEWEVSENLPDEEVFYIEVLPPWRMYFDGAARKNGSGAGVLFMSPSDDLMLYSFILSHCCTNNEAEYQAIILGLGMVVEMGLSQLEIFDDSALVIKQLIGEFEVQKEELIPHKKEAQRLLEKIPNVTLGHVPRASNSQANALAGIAASLAQFDARPERIPICERWVVPTLEKFSGEEEVNLVSVYAIEEEDWRQQFLDYLEHKKLPQELKAQAYVRRVAPKFCLFNNTLYRRSYDGILLRCVSKEEGQALLSEAHGGIYGAHQAGPKLHLQVKQLGYYWPTMLWDTIELARHCTTCQLHGNYIHQPPSPLHPTVASWPFEAWGMDIIGPINPKSSQNHPKTVAGNKKDWHERLGEALWAYRITFLTPTESTLYSLVYGVEAVLPLEIQIPSLRVALREGLTEEENIRLHLQELESLDEKRLEAQQRLECYQARLTRAFNKKVKLRSFKKRDLVLAAHRPIMATSRDGGKFAPKWEGPFVVQEVYANGAYKLVTPKGRRLLAINEIDSFGSKFDPTQMGRDEVNAIDKTEVESTVWERRDIDLPNQGHQRREREIDLPSQRRDIDLPNQRHGREIDLPSQRRDIDLPNQRRGREIDLPSQRRDINLPNQRRGREIDLPSIDLPNQRRGREIDLPSQRRDIDLPNQRLRVEVLPNQRLRVEVLPNQRLRVEVLPNQRLRVEVLPNQRLRVEVLPNQRLRVEVLPNQRLRVEVLPNQRLRVEVLPNQRLRVEVLPNQRLRVEVLPNQRLGCQSQVQSR
ncbi:hypothetical protein H6P81_012580 [Aristolochia fimbriata]|uniref:RNase H type-1 domain-containing protein n=1 Tax=Aristolochia fimbriata TaxID=158543 RepID=A0AAV7EC86_ARIFI|nr:hypothetical protein H6P81_012580 [Aristolochia fimbriata]